MDWAESKMAQGAQGFTNWLGRETSAHPLGMTVASFIVGTAMSLGGVQVGAASAVAASEAARMWEEGQAEILTLTKHTDGLYYWVTPVALENKEMGSTSKHMWANRISEGHKKSWWMHRGAYTTTGTMGIQNNDMGQYDSFDETFVAHCDQYNSIFF